MKIVFDANTLTTAGYVRQGEGLPFAETVIEAVRSGMAESIVVLPEILAESFLPLSAAALDIYGEIYEAIQQCRGAHEEGGQEYFLHAKNRLMQIFHGKLDVGAGALPQGKRLREEEELDVLLYLAPYIEIPPRFLDAGGAVDKAKVRQYCQEQKLNEKKPDRGEGAVVDYMVGEGGDYVFITSDINAIERYRSYGRERDAKALTAYENRLARGETDQRIYVVSVGMYVRSIAGIHEHYVSARKTFETLARDYAVTLDFAGFVEAVLMATAYEAGELLETAWRELAAPVSAAPGQAMPVTEDSRKQLAEAYEAVLKKHLRFFWLKERPALQTDIALKLQENEPDLARHYDAYLRESNLAYFRKAADIALLIFSGLAQLEFAMAVEKFATPPEDETQPARLEASQLMNALNDTACQLLCNLVEIPLLARIPAMHALVKSIAHDTYVAEMKNNPIKFGKSPVIANEVNAMLDDFYASETGRRPAHATAVDFDALHTDLTALNALFSKRIEFLNRWAQSLPLPKKTAQAIFTSMEQNPRLNERDRLAEYHAAGIPSFAEHMFGAYAERYYTLLRQQAEAKVLASRD